MGLKMERDKDKKKTTCTDEEYVCVESHKNPAGEQYLENICAFNYVLI